MGKFACMGATVAQSVQCLDYGLDNRGSIPDRGRGFFSSLCVQTGCEAHPSSCAMGTWGPFPGDKAWPGRDADHSPPSSAKVKNE
jgi:hypothetical protein